MGDTHVLSVRYESNVIRGERIDVNWAISGSELLHIINPFIYPNNTWHDPGIDPLTSFISRCTQTHATNNAVIFNIHIFFLKANRNYLFYYLNVKQ